MKQRVVTVLQIYSMRNHPVKTHAWSLANRTDDRDLFCPAVVNICSYSTSIKEKKIMCACVSIPIRDFCPPPFFYLPWYILILSYIMKKTKRLHPIKTILPWNGFCVSVPSNYSSETNILCDFKHKAIKKMILS